LGERSHKDSQLRYPLYNPRSTGGFYLCAPRDVRKKTEFHYGRKTSNYDHPETERSQLRRKKEKTNVYMFVKAKIVENILTRINVSTPNAWCSDLASLVIHDHGG